MGMRRVFIGVAALLLTNASFAATSNIGATPGSFNVSPSGAANYTIPIAIPPGVNGMQPGLVFSYNSQGGNGLLGMGWNLGGLSTLHRCPATYEQDTYKGGVNLDANDRFCLDGQRLLVVNGLAYGADGAEYRTEIESFTKIISYGNQGGGPAYFKAWTKTGQIIEFGATADARIEAQGKSVVLAWPVNKIQDTTGNYLTVSYTENNAAGEYYPARIDYTGNANTGLAPTRSVQFAYAARPDVETSYINGSRSQTAQRLTGVRTFVGAGLVRDYRLAYDLSAATARSRLVSVQECTGDGVCLGATQLGWQNGGDGFSTPIQSYPAGWNFEWGNAWEAITGDFNSDGKTDYARLGATYTQIFRSNGDGTFSPSTQHYPAGWNFENPSPWKTIIGDFNGDGKTDYARLGATAAHFFVGNPLSPDLLTTLTTPLGIQVKDITYKPLTDASVYTKENSAAYPLLDLQAPLYVVASYATTNGSGFNTTTHTYAGAKVHQTGRGYLGFRVVTETAPNGIKSTTTYRQDYPYMGLPTQVDVQQPNGGLLSRTLTTWNAINYGGGRYLPYAQSTTASSYELNGALITSATTVNDLLDSYGNVGRTTVTHSDNHKKVVLSSYDNDTVNWRLGRPVSTQVGSILPNGQGQKRTSSFSYHATTGLLIKDIIEPGTALALTTDTAYDAYGHKASVTVSGPDIVTRTSTFAYLTSPGEAFAQTRSTNALGHSETQVLDARFGVPVSLTGPNGLTTTWAYDGFGRKLQENRADGTSSSWSYNSCGGQSYEIKVIATGAPTRFTCYNTLGREWLRGTQGFDGQYVHVGTQYDEYGRVLTTSRPHAIPFQYKTFYNYDLLGRVVSELKPTNLSTQYTYQGLSTTVKVSGVLPGGSQSTTQIKNSQGQLVQAIDAAGNSTTYSYDPFGNLVKVVDAKSNILTMGYDLRGRKTSMVDPDMGSWIYQYNTLGELTYQLDAKNQAVTMQYDVLGRLIKRTGPEGISQWSYDTVANGKGKPATVTSPGGYARSYVYDNLGRTVRVSTTINATTYLMDTGYDAVGRVASTAYPTANGQRFTVYTQYNASGYLTAVTNSAGFVYWQANARDAEGHLLQETLGNGLVTTRSYNIASGAVQSIRTGATNNVQNLNYAFDYLGNLQSRNDAIQNITETFGYDVLNRLTSVSGPAPKTYAYDSIGNITSKSDVGTYSYGAKPHAVTATTGAVNATYIYDAHGNMIQSGSGREMVYTSFNLPSFINKGSRDTFFTYDADHARTTQTTAGETTVYLNPRWDLGGHYEKTTKSNGVVEHKHYIYGSNGVAALYTLKGDGTSTTRYLHKDPLGSVDTITSETGAVLERFSYDAFGKRRLPNGTDGAVVAATTHHGYTGHEMHDDLGLVNMNGRFYDPALGRFTQADPYIQDPTNSQSLNRYAYVVNNPFKYTDPSGYKFFLSNLTFSNIKKFAAQETTNVVRQLSNIPYVGGLATIGLFGYSPIFSAAYGWSNNDWSTVAKAHAKGLLITGTYYLGGQGVLGRMVGGGVNGYLQSRTPEGFVRGFLAGGIPVNLGFDAYYANPYANIGIGILRDGIRGGIVGGKDGVLSGIAYGQANNAVGHLIGFVSGEYKGFNNGAFLYEKPEGGGITFGNVIVGGRDFLGYPTLVAHERDHIFNQVEQGFGVLYGPIHALDLLIGKGGELLGYGCSGYVIEQHVNVHPYASIGHPCAY